MCYNYKYLRARFKPNQLKQLDDSWVRISKAATYFGLSKQTIRLWIFKDKIKSGLFKNILYVKL